MVATVRQFEISPRVCSRLEDGSVVTWGDEDYGGDSSAVRDQLKGVQQIGRWIRRYLRLSRLWW